MPLPGVSSEIVIAGTNCGREKFRTFFPFPGTCHVPGQKIFNFDNFQLIDYLQVSKINVFFSPLSSLIIFKFGFYKVVFF
jgi:hypothetical protein